MGEPDLLLRVNKSQLSEDQALWHLEVTICFIYLRVLQSLSKKVTLGQLQ